MRGKVSAEGRRMRGRAVRRVAAKPTKACRSIRDRRAARAASLTRAPWGATPCIRHASRDTFPPQGGKGFGGGRHRADRVHTPGGATSTRRRQAACAAAPLRFAPSGDRADPMWRFASMIFGETSRPLGRLRSPKIMAANGLSRAEGSRLAKRPRKRLGLDAEHGSGSLRSGVAPRAQQSLSDLPNFGYHALGSAKRFAPVSRGADRGKGGRNSRGAVRQAFPR